MNFQIIFFVKNDIEIQVIRCLINKFQSYSDDWPTSANRKPPFLTKFGLRLHGKALGFDLTTPILEAARSNHSTFFD